MFGVKLGKNGLGFSFGDFFSVTSGHLALSQFFNTGFSTTILTL
jgi:hypothetical protein